MTGLDMSILWAALVRGKISWEKKEKKTASARVKDQLAKMDWRLLPRGMIYSNFLPFALAFSFSLSLISSPHFVQPFSIQHTESRSSLFIKRLFSSGKLQPDPYFITTLVSLFFYISHTHIFLLHHKATCNPQTIETPHFKLNPKKQCLVPFFLYSCSYIWLLQFSERLIPICRHSLSFTHTFFFSMEVTSTFCNHI